MVYPAAKLYAFETACRLFISISDRKHIWELHHLFSEFLDGVISIPLNFPGTKYYRAKKAVKHIRGELREIITQRKSSPAGSWNPEDLLSYLLQNGDENGRFLTDDEIVNNLLVFLIAGHEPTSSTITSLVKFLAEMPHVYRTILQEQREIAKLKKPGERLKPEDIRMMKYSWSVVSEVIRLVPPVIGAFRVALEDFSYGG
ncbi:hypothetical protein CDL15_Pgr000359 [Punica granatum]|nr:hypothetical protein CDL15_Pgr000359 [Punica granatum]